MVCSICGKTRPEENIDVFKNPILENGKEIGTQDIRYCNDNPKCLRGALEYLANYWKDYTGGS